MGKDAQDEFTPLSLMAARGQDGAEAALVLAEAALDVPAMVVGHFEK